MIEWAKILSHNTPTFRQNVTAANAEVTAVCASGKTLVTASFDCMVRVWSVPHNRCVRVLKGHESPVLCATMIGVRVVTGSWDHTLRVWNVARGKCEATLRGHRGGVSAVLVNRNIIVSGSVDRSVRVWHRDESRELFSLVGHEDCVWSLCWYRHDMIASGSKDGSVRLWDLTLRECIAVLPGHASTVLSIACFRNVLFVGTKSGMAHVWNLTHKTIDDQGESIEATCVRTLRAHKDAITCATTSGSVCFTGSLDRTVGAWDLASDPTLFQHHSLGQQMITPTQAAGLKRRSSGQWWSQILSKHVVYDDSITCLVVHGRSVVVGNVAGQMCLSDW